MADSPSTGTSWAESTRPLAPGVVATLIVRHPSPLLEDVLAALANQDYPNLQTLVLVARADSDAMNSIAHSVRTHLPDAHVRQVDGSLGFGQAANSVLSLVDGASGYFLFLRDDVAPAPNAVRVMVEEAFRSNAGLVGPKFVEWDDPRLLVNVGFACDRLGEVDSGIDAREMDQEQHDGVGDVFMLSSACVLSRADLFRVLQGFEPTIDTSGEDLDLCWRAHLSGARVMVAPSAVVRHHRSFAERRESFDTAAEREKNRVLTVASLTGSSRLVVVAPILVLANAVSALWALVRGKSKTAKTRLAAIGGLITRSGSISSRRRRVRRIRRVPDKEIAELQIRGSIRWRRLRRKREIDRKSADVSGRTGTTSDSMSVPSMLVGAGLVVLFFLGARQILSSGTSAVGEMLPLKTSPGELMASYTSGWWVKDLGSASPQPTADALTAVLGFLALGKMGLVHTLMTIGLIPMGWWGAARLLRVFAHERARLTGILVYAAVPLPYAAVAAGRHQVLIAYAAIPWALHLLRTFSGIGGPVVDEDRRDVVEHPFMTQRLKAVAKLSILFAVTMAFSPVAVLAILLCAFLWLIAATLGGGSVRSAGLSVAASISAFSAAVVLNMPWITRLLSSDGWSAIAGIRTRGVQELGWWDAMKFDVGATTLGGIILLLYIPLVVAPLIARHSRFLWGLRGMVLVLGGIVLTTLNVSGRLPLGIADNGILLAMSAMGLSIGVAVTVMSLGVDVLGGRFGWRQPTAILSLVVIPVGLFPVATAAVSGDWNQPSATLYGQLHSLIGDTSSGDSRTLVVGDTRMMIGGGHGVGDGLAYSLIDNAQASILDRWTPDPKEVDKLVRPLIEAVAGGRTLRVGRLMAPLGIRYIVIPLIDRVHSTSAHPMPAPIGLVESFSGQLDLEKVYSPPSMVIFENSQWIPVASLLSESASAARTAGGASALVSVDLSGSTPILEGSTAFKAPTQTIGPGVVHWGVPFNSSWSLSKNGVKLSGQASFGSVMAFDVGEGGTVHLVYDRSISRMVWIVIQAILWTGMILMVLQPRRRRRPVPIQTEPVLSTNEPSGFLL